MHCLHLYVLILILLNSFLHISYFLLQYPALLLNHNVSILTDFGTLHRMPVTVIAEQISMIVDLFTHNNVHIRFIHCNHSLQVLHNICHQYFFCSIINDTHSGIYHTLLTHLVQHPGLDVYMECDWKPFWMNINQRSWENEFVARNTMLVLLPNLYNMLTPWKTLHIILQSISWHSGGRSCSMHTFLVIFVFLGFFVMETAWPSIPDTSIMSTWPWLGANGVMYLKKRNTSAHTMTLRLES